MELNALSDVLDGWDVATTVTVDLTATDEAGPHQREVRWRDLRRQAAEQGAPEADLAAIDEAVLRPVDAGGPLSRFVAARDGRVVLEELLYESQPDGVGSVRVSPVVDVVPLLRYEQRHCPLTVVHADREGADIEVVTAAGAPGQDGATTGGSTMYIRKVNVGGWRHAHYQRVSENVWRSNAEDTAAEVQRLRAANAAPVVLLSGDVRARQLIASALADDVPVVQVDAETRAEGASRVSVDAAVTRILEDAADQDEREAIERWLAVRDDGAIARSAPDLQSAVAALRQGQVEELLLVPELLRDRTLVVGPAGTDLTLPGAPATWDGEGRSVPADLALIRAAALTGAQVRLVSPDPATVPDGAVARLRWSNDPDTGATAGTDDEEADR